MFVSHHSHPFLYLLPPISERINTPDSSNMRCTQFLQYGRGMQPRLSCRMSALYFSVHLAAMLLASFRSSAARPVLHPPGKVTRQRHWKSVKLHVQICARSGVQDLDGHLGDGSSERRIMGPFVFQDRLMRLSDTGYCTGGTDGLFAVESEPTVLQTRHVPACQWSNPKPDWPRRRVLYPVSTPPGVHVGFT
jgi:hypothetical protein